jgi:hypothetical protein
MSLQIKFRLKNHEFLLHTFSITAKVMVLLKVLFQGVVVEIVVGMSRVSSVTDKATLVLHSAMLVQLVIVVKALSTESTQWVALEACLVCCTRLVVSMTHVLL